MNVGSSSTAHNGLSTDGPILALDTATDEVSVAVCTRTAILSEQRWTSVRRQTVELAPRVSEALESAGVEPRDLIGIAVAIGPGSYTGLRVGLAFAKGLSLVTGTPIVGIPTLDGLALSLTRPRAERDDPLVAIIRAGRGRLIGMRYEADAMPLGDRRSEIEALVALPLERLFAAAPPGTWVAGELDSEQREWLSGQGFHVVDPSRERRSAEGLAEFARKRLEAGDTDNAAELSPIYPGGRAIAGPQPASKE